MKSPHTLLIFFTKTIDARFTKAFATKMHYSNIEQCHLISLVALILVAIETPIHVLRYQAGTLLNPEFPKGTRKFAYDIWGDAVNIAARIENACEVGKIYISDDTYQHVQGHYDCTLKTAIELKNIGKMNLWAMEAN